MGTAELRSAVHASWGSVADKWGAYADALEQHEAGLSDRMLDAAAIKPGDRVLELACGPAGVGLAAATRVGPQGEVVLSDVAPEMVAIAAARAQTGGLTWVSTRVLDLEEIDEPAASFDVVLCRQGLMFAVDPRQAAREIARVLRPGGRTAVSVWGPRPDNPWLALVMESVSATLGQQLPPPGIPGPFDLDDRAHLRTILTAADLLDVVVDDVAGIRRWSSFDEWWQWTSALAGPLANVLAAMPAETVTAITDRLRAAAAPYMHEAGVELPSLAFVASARKA
jgi:ubiquinone/menaquinone biosynthesis C-methylase UbiE